MKNFLRLLLPEQRKQLGLAVALVAAAGLIAFIWDQRSSEDASLPEKPEAESVEDAATYIPDGFVLVPIEVANFESLDSILGKFGVVDLFVGSDDPRARPQKIAQQVKILRAPLNPNHFAVLVPDNESQKIVAFSGAFTVVVKNPKKSGPTLVKPDTARPKSRSRVIVEVSNAL